MEFAMNMSGESLLIIIIVGVVAGWLAGQLVRGAGFGLIGDLIIGIVGAFIGGWLLPRLGIHLGVGIVSSIVNATIGAVVLLLLVRLSEVVLAGVVGGFKLEIFADILRQPTQRHRWRRYEGLQPPFDVRREHLASRGRLSHRASALLFQPLIGSASSRRWRGRGQLCIKNTPDNRN